MDEKFVANKLVEHDDRFDIIDVRLVAIDERFDQLEAKVDALATGIVTKDQFLTTMDKLTRAVERIDQERVFQIHRHDRHEEEIDKIKTKIGLTEQG